MNTLSRQQPAAAASASELCKAAEERTAPVDNDLQLVLLRYHDGSRHARHWHTARVAVAPGLHAGDTVRFDPMTCAVSPTDH